VSGARVAACCVALCGACSPDAPNDADAEPTARVIVSIDAEPRVAERTAALRVRLQALAALPTAGMALPSLEEPTRTVLYEVFTWPVRLELPEDMLAEGPAFSLEAAALDIAGRELTTARLITAEREGRLLEPEVMLHARCLDVICGARSSTCGERGFCGSAVRAPEDFPGRLLD